MKPFKDRQRLSPTYLRCLTRWLLACVVGASAARDVVAEQTAGAVPSEADLEFFEKQIRPLLAKRCYECHGPDVQEGNLRLDRRSSAWKGGDSGPAVVPGKPDEGFLIDAVKYGGVYEMPPTGKLPDREIDLLTDWVRRGAPWPDDPHEGKDASSKRFDVERLKREHWSWRPLVDQAPPKTAGSDWALNAIDRFILAKLQQQQLVPARPADRGTWLRRVTYDLIGLPPTPEEIREFESAGPDAYEKAVDRLLASPHFGERWARHWLDLVRYAESKGHEFDYPTPNAFQYRDYVIRSFNADVPYNQFVIEHIAGDLVPDPRMHPTANFNESVLGTGFWHLGEEVHSPVDIRGDETDRIDNKVDVLGKAFLGLTIGCARCHDHKFDAISTRDYYALSSFVLSSRYRQVRFESEEHNRRVAAQLAELETQAQKLWAPMLAEQWKRRLSRLADYLLAARAAALQTLAEELAAEPSPEAVRQRIEQAAADRQLDASRLTSWFRHLTRETVGDASSPFHDWSQRMGRPVWTVESNGSPTPGKAETPADCDVLVDYAALQPGDWITDGFAFGNGPVRPGELQLSDDPQSPIQSVHALFAAEYRPVWDRLTLAPGTQRDPGRVGAWVRAGRTLHTRTFSIPNRKLYYLVRGAAHVYASVDSHQLLNGPLHGVVVQELNGGDDFQWFEHDLRTYAGHRVHLEFTPKAAKDQPGSFAIARIVAADEKPAPLAVNLAGVLSSQGDASAEDYAHRIQNTFLQAVDRFEASAHGRTELSPPDAALVKWLTDHLPLTAEESFPGQLAERSREILATRAQLHDAIRASSATAPALMDGDGVDGYVLVRGNHKVLGEPAPRQFLEAMPELSLEAPRDGSGRLELAYRMTDPRNPYISRVLVNRLWHHLFGTGIVTTVDNFGVLGQPPSHPELLDHLACRFIDSGWSVKKMLRMMVLSQTYRMSSRPIEEQRLRDPQNRWLHCMPVRRLQAEAIRDGVLAVSGRLNRRQYGPSVPVYLTPFMDGRGRPESGPLDGDGRRSLYLAVRRNFLSPMMLAFDAPIPFNTVGRRTVSNVPAQSLTMMNDPFVVEQARRWAERLLAEPDSTPSRIQRLYLAAFGREPSDAEIAAIVEFLEEQAADYGLSAAQGETDVRPWADLCHLLLQSKEFLFLP